MQFLLSDAARETGSKFPVYVLYAVLFVVDHRAFDCKTKRESVWEGNPSYDRLSLCSLKNIKY